MPPPPPPPGPPPPPLLGALFKPSSNSGGDNRNALLSSIQKGAKLKKTVTVDKSGPLISGKTTSNDQPRRPNAGPNSGTNKKSPETTSPNNARPVLDFSSELAQKLTLKKKKASGESPQSVSHLNSKNNAKISLPKIE